MRQFKDFSVTTRPFPPVGIDGIDGKSIAALSHTCCHTIKKLLPNQRKIFPCLGSKNAHVPSVIPSIPSIPSGRNWNTIGFSSDKGRPTMWGRLSANGRTTPFGWPTTSHASHSRGCGDSRLSPAQGLPHDRGVSRR